MRVDEEFGFVAELARTKVVSLEDLARILYVELVIERAVCRCG